MSDGSCWHFRQMWTTWHHWWRHCFLCNISIYFPADMVLHARRLQHSLYIFIVKTKTSAPPHRYTAWCWIKYGQLYHCFHWISWVSRTVYMNFVWKGLGVTLRQEAIYPVQFSSVFPRSYFQCHHQYISYAPNSIHRVATYYQMVWRTYA